MCLNPGVKVRIKSPIKESIIVNANAFTTKRLCPDSLQFLENLILFDIQMLVISEILFNNQHQLLHGKGNFLWDFVKRKKYSLKFSINHFIPSAFDHLSVQSVGVYCILVGSFRFDWLDLFKAHSHIKYEKHK